MKSGKHPSAPRFTGTSYETKTWKSSPKNRAHPFEPVKKAMLSIFRPTREITACKLA